MRKFCMALARRASAPAFRLQLIKISAVWARARRSGILSGMSVADDCASRDGARRGRLIKVPGIGKKTAERLLLELKGKFGADLGLAPSARHATPKRYLAGPCWRWATATKKRLPHSRLAKADVA
jgi:3-methyladenine DNA glycosylase/8-oxoguanine DNA glycosylase